MRDRKSGSMHRALTAGLHRSGAQTVQSAGHEAGHHSYLTWRLFHASRLCRGLEISTSAQLLSAHSGNCQHCSIKRTRFAGNFTPRVCSGS